MSGISSEWERHYEPSRDFIERLSEESKLSAKVRRLKNRDLAADLYRIAEVYPECSMICMEAAERLTPETEIVTLEEARRH